MSGASLWMEEAEGALPLWKPIEGPRRERTVIVGAGLAGLGLAQSLRARGEDPIVVDAVGPGHGASGRNAGFVLRTHVSAYPALRAAIGADRAATLLDLAHDTHARIARYGLTSEHRASGSLMLAAAGDAADARVLREARQLLQQDGVRADITDVPPGLAGFDFAVVLADDGEVHPGRLVASLASGVRGGVLDVRSVDWIGRRVVGDAGIIEADRIVLATNARLGELAPALLSTVTPQRAQMLATSALPPTLDRPCYAGNGFDYFRQRTDGRVLLGGRRHLFLEPERTTSTATTDDVQRALEDYLALHLPFARGAAIEARWAGTMGFSPDGLPLAGRVPGFPDGWLLGGFTGHGLGLALGLADRLAEAMLGPSPEGAISDDPVLSRLRPDRFSAMVTPR